jgi:carnitine O-acetyltransferase
LKSTCEKYLKTVKALSSPEDFEATKKSVEEFLQPGGVGEQVKERRINDLVARTTAKEIS